MTDHIAIITVVYNNYENLKDFFASFDTQSDDTFHIYVSDASATRKSVEIPEFAEMHEEMNGGYAYGLNKGLERAMQDGYEKFVCINDDVIVDKNFVKEVKKALSNHPESLIGGKIYYASGYEYHKDRYEKKDRGKVLWYAGGEMDWANAFGVHKGVDMVDDGSYDKEEQTEFVTGCLMAFDKALIEKAGKMDESYFMYYEDTDWNQQILKAGCEIWYDPRIIIWHKNSQSTDGSGSDFQRTYQRKNIVKFGLRYAPLRTKLHLINNFVRGR